MNKLTRILLLLFGVVLICIAICAGKSNAGHVVLNRHIVDFGKLPQGSSVSQSVLISNKGKKELHLAAHKTGCNCVSLHLEKEILSAGESTFLTIALTTDFLSRSGRSGDIDVLLETNDPKMKIIPINVRYEPGGDLWISPPVIDFGRLTRNELPILQNAEVTLSALNNSEKSCLVDIQSSDPYIQIENIETQSDQGLVKFTIILNETAPIGEIYSQILVKIRDSFKSTADGFVYNTAILGEIKGDFYSIPKTAIISTSETNPLKLSVVHRENIDFKIKDVSLDTSLNDYILIEYDSERMPVTRNEILIHPKKETTGKVYGYLHLLCETDSFLDERMRIPVILGP